MLETNLEKQIINQIYLLILDKAILNSLFLGAFNFYDGKIMAINEEFTYLIDGTVANMPGGYSVHEEINEDKKIAYLLAN